VAYMASKSLLNVSFGAFSIGRLTPKFESRYRGYVDFRMWRPVMAPVVRMSGPTLKVLKMLVEHPQEGRSGAEISKLCSIGSGTLYPLLQRLENAGWLASEWED